MGNSETIVDLGKANFDIGLGGDEETKKPVGSFTRVAGKSGPAVRFDFVDHAHGGVISTPVHPSPAWDEAAGISFWIKGDGSKELAAISFADGERGQVALGVLVLH